MTVLRRKSFARRYLGLRGHAANIILCNRDIPETQSAVTLADLVQMCR
jgi:hypothetical protein